jgi:hypothetical protein
MLLVLFLAFLPISVKSIYPSFLVIVMLFLGSRIVFAQCLLQTFLLLTHSLFPAALSFLFLLLCSQNIFILSINALSFSLLPLTNNLRLPDFLLL